MFVRTKTGIYDLEVKDNKDINYYQINDDFEEETYGGKTGRVLYIPSKAVLKQADTIEELCDEFIHDNQIIRFESGSKKYFHYLGDDFDFDVDKKMIEEGIYGAIWTDKGLIYVAKMNEEKDMVLI